MKLIREQLLLQKNWVFKVSWGEVLLKLCSVLSGSLFLTGETEPLTFIFVFFVDNTFYLQTLVMATATGCCSGFEVPFCWTFVSLTV